jgi:hypothetical protein
MEELPSLERCCSTRLSACVCDIIWGLFYTTRILTIRRSIRTWFVWRQITTKMTLSRERQRRVTFVMRLPQKIDDDGHPNHSSLLSPPLSPSLSVSFASTVYRSFLFSRLHVWVWLIQQWSYSKRSNRVTKTIHRLMWLLNPFELLVMLFLRRSSSLLLLVVIFAVSLTTYHAVPSSIFESNQDDDSYHHTCQKSLSI